MIAKVAMLFVGVVVFGAFLNLFGICSAFFLQFLLGVNSPAITTAQYWVGFILSAAVTFPVMRHVWPKAR
jgi:hypothetical protein